MKHVYVDLTWRHQRFGGFEHYSDQIIRNYGADDGFTFMVCDLDQDKDYLRSIKNLMPVKYRKFSNKYLQSLYYYYFRLVKLFLLQRKHKGAHLYPALPPPMLKSGTVSYVIHDVGQFMAPHLYPKGFHSLFFWSFYNYLMTRRSDTVATVSQTSRKQVASTMKIDPERVFVTYNYLDTVSTGTASFNGGKRYNLLFIGRLIKRKNCRVLLEIAQYLKDAGLDAKYRVVVLGQSTDYWHSILPEFDEGLNIVHREQISEEDKLGYLRSSIMINPSFFEGFGIPILEAVNQACPVICSPLEVFREILGPAGIYFDFEGNRNYRMLMDIVEGFDGDQYRHYLSHRDGILDKFSPGEFKQQFDRLLEAV